MEEIKKFTKFEKEILGNRGFEESGEILKHPKKGHQIEKISTNKYHAYFKYPPSEGYKGLSSPNISFEELLDRISKFKRYYD